MSLLLIIQSESNLMGPLLAGPFFVGCVYSHDDDHMLCVGVAIAIPYESVADTFMARSDFGL
jgi:hypothetical protein